ncbi:hypothetical protein [Marivita sp. XM-24bin2]|jgi:hypothetical protein|uniref:hypothetical protein n=1 Tax=unclassified Marivita TaxID=2632480 RepID=UPI000D79B04A|nr:hypothetical protein [Marivita sp. XM-24bin2]MCR9110516.1 hypothetical protein [Paracoccaceae bacterium]PWL35230.1 MAG: hypothetical protein DCO97_10180 [Marivita sp. XM-24bin2]
MHLKPVATEDTVIGQVLTKFAAGDTSLFELIAEDIDFRIDHFRDEIDTSWQQAETRDGLTQVIGRLGQEVFPKGTEALAINCFELGAGWNLTCFNQRFFYGLRQKDVTSLTYIVSHEADGQMDYFRETVTNIVNRQETA